MKYSSYYNSNKWVKTRMIVLDIYIRSGIGLLAIRVRSHWKNWNTNTSQNIWKKLPYCLLSWSYYLFKIEIVILNFKLNSEIVNYTYRYLFSTTSMDYSWISQIVFKEKGKKMTALCLWRNMHNIFPVSPLINL